MSIRLTSKTPRMELLEIERKIGRLPAGSRMEWDEHLHLYAMLFKIRSEGRCLHLKTLDERGEVLNKLTDRGFYIQYAGNLMLLAAAGTQPLVMLVREAALRTELGRIAE